MKGRTVIALVSALVVLPTGIATATPKASSQLQIQGQSTEVKNVSRNTNNNRNRNTAVSGSSSSSTNSNNSGAVAGSNSEVKNSGNNTSSATGGAGGRSEVGVDTRSTSQALGGNQYMLDSSINNAAFEFPTYNFPVNSIGNVSCAHDALNFSLYGKSGGQGNVDFDASAGAGGRNGEFGGVVSYSLPLGGSSCKRAQKLVIENLRLQNEVLKKQLAAVTAPVPVVTAPVTTNLPVPSHPVPVPSVPVVDWQEGSEVPPVRGRF